MSVLAVSKSNVPLVFDTLPAWKVRHYESATEKEKLYTLAQMYVHGEDLALSLRVFEKTPALTSCVGFCVSKLPERALFAQLTPEKLTLSLCTQKADLSLDAPLPLYQAGSDEQGWFWGASFTLSAKELQRVGLILSVGATFSANLIKFADEKTAYGTAFYVPPKQAFWTPSSDPCFQVVDY